MDVHIRPERPEDHRAIHALVTSAFGQHLEADLVDALRTAGDLAISLVAEDASGLVGHIAMSRLRSPPGALALAPLAVSPTHQRTGIGSTLVVEGLNAARGLGCPAVFVLGDPAYYGRFGFRAETAAPFPSPYSGPHFLAIALGPPPLLPAPLVYPAAFDALDGT